MMRTKIAVSSTSTGSWRAGPNDEIPDAAFGVATDNGCFIRAAVKRMSRTAQRSLAHWDAFQKSVDELNDFVRPYVLRRYQSDLLNSGVFRVISPVSGATVEVCRSVMLDGGRVAYPVGGPVRVWLITGALKSGFPLHELVREDDGSVHPIIDPWFKKWSALAPVVVADFKTRRRPESHGQLAPAITLLVGSGHFAHHLWNELSALDEWLNSVPEDRLQSISVCAVYEPLGPLRTLFPRLGACQFIELTQLAQNGGVALGGSMPWPKSRHYIFGAGWSGGGVEAPVALAGSGACAWAGTMPRLRFAPRNARWHGLSIATVWHPGLRIELEGSEAPTSFASRA
jgi:hypothetical protein